MRHYFEIRGASHILRLGCSQNNWKLLIIQIDASNSELGPTLSSLPLPTLLMFLGQNQQSFVYFIAYTPNPINSHYWEMKYFWYPRGLDLKKSQSLHMWEGTRTCRKSMSHQGFNLDTGVRTATPYHSCKKEQTNYMEFCNWSDKALRLNYLCPPVTSSIDESQIYSWMGKSYRPWSMGLYWNWSAQTQAFLVALTDDSPFFYPLLISNSNPNNASLSSSTCNPLTFLSLLLLPLEIHLLFVLGAMETAAPLPKTGPKGPTTPPHLWKLWGDQRSDCKGSIRAVGCWFWAWDHGESDAPLLPLVEEVWEDLCVLVRVEAADCAGGSGSD